MRLVDTHVHINFESFQADLERVRDRWMDAGVAFLIHSCVVPSEFPTTLALTRRYPELYASVGLHPLESHRWNEEVAAAIAASARSSPKVVAIGETGLDLYKDDRFDRQVQACWGQLCIARALEKPVIIHCRSAAAPLRKLLQEFWQQEGPVAGVMHCWGGSPQETDWFLELGFHISFSGIVTFKNASTVRESAALVPDERLLIETDCPFLAPVPMRGSRNEPAYVRHVAAAVAQARSTTVEAIAALATNNACTLFGLPSPEPVALGGCALVGVDAAREGREIEVQMPSAEP